MKGDKIRYRENRKYQLEEDYTVALGFTIPKTIVTGWLILSVNGCLTIRKGYAWDGASGPTFDTSSSMRGALVHDAGYQLMRLGLLPESYRSIFDDLLHNICVEDGMWHWRAEGWEEAVSHFAAGCAESGSESKIKEAP